MIEVIDNRDNRNSKFGRVGVGTVFCDSNGNFCIKAGFNDSSGERRFFGIDLETGFELKLGEDDMIEVLRGTLEVER